MVFVLGSYCSNCNQCCSDATFGTGCISILRSNMYSTEVLISDRQAAVSLSQYAISRCSIHALRAAIVMP
jgi:hypothetical protein